MKHVVVFSAEDVGKLLKGELEFDLRFFKKKPEFLKELNVGDVIYFRKSRREILGEFEVGKLIIIEKPEMGDWDWIKSLNHESRIRNYGKAEFEEKIKGNNVLIIIQIKKLEQLITSPVEIYKRSRKEWTVLSEE